MTGSLKNCGESSPLVYNFKTFSENKYLRKLIKLIVTPYCFLKYFFVRDVPGREGLALVLMIKNEAPYLEEWINFHLKQGVSHIIILDNESTDNFLEVIAPYVASGLVSCHKIKGRLPQAEAYNKATALYKNKFKYLGFIDADEFLFVRDKGGTKNLYEFLENFMKAHKNAGGLGVNWLVFGSSGHKTKQPGGVLKNFLMCSEKNFLHNHHIKTICDPLKVLAWSNPHFPFFRRGFYNFDENGEIIDGPFSKEVHFEKIRINHYYSKSLEEFIAKKDKGNAVGVAIRDMEAFHLHDQNIIKDTEILSRI